MIRSVDDLAADVKAGLERIRDRHFIHSDNLSRETSMEADILVARASELVALVGTLTQERQERLDADQPIFVPGDTPKSMFARWCDERERAEAAEAALADMRRAAWPVIEANYATAGEQVAGKTVLWDAIDNLHRALAAAGPAPWEGHPDPSSHGGHPYTPTEIAMGYGTPNDPRFRAAGPAPEEGTA